MYAHRYAMSIEVLMRCALRPALLLLAACAAEADALPYGASAAACAECHEGHAAEWGTSAHAASAASPVFVAMLPEVETNWGASARDTCVGCHAPEHGDDEAVVTCVSCHAAVGNHAERDGRLAVDLTAPLAGPLGAGAIATDAHTSAPRGLLTDATLCGTCHEVTGPELLQEGTLSEHGSSPAAAEGFACVDCHAPPTAARALTADTPVRPSRDHRFVGFDPPWGADADTAAAAAAETQALLSRALSLAIETRVGAREAVVTNIAGGHSVPTGVSFLRDLWLDVEVDGVALVEPLLRIGDQPLADSAPVALLTDADQVRAGSLAAGESIRVVLPAGELVLRLRARAVRPEVLAALGLEDLATELPVHELAVVAEAAAPR